MPTDIAHHPDRLLPADPTTRAVARRLLEHTQDLPIISPHGHVDPRLLLDNQPFPDPTQLLISPDHYVTRLMHANGVDLGQLRVGGSTDASAREAWRLFCSHWNDFDGTASGYWLREEFSTVFGVDDASINTENADAIYDQLTERIAREDMRPRALFERFNIEVLATTDDPVDDLEAHRLLRDDPTFTGRVLPTFRPDAYVTLGPQFADRVQSLLAAAGISGTDFASYLGALQSRRQYFVDHGAVSADHGALTPRTLRMDPAEAQRLFAKGLAGTATPEEARAFEAHMLYQMARMSTEDGLVMTIHPGVHRNTHPDTLRRFGPDTGHDIPFGVDYSTGLRHILEDFGTTPGFHLIPFTIDETVFSREIAPLAGFYPSVFIGAPWWFLDAPDAMNRFREAVTETAGFTRGSGFIDDTRAFCSIPARHDASRRVDAGYLARLVSEHRLNEDRAVEIAIDLVDGSPRRAFKL
jgi:glucuronate isomerase